MAKNKNLTLYIVNFNIILTMGGGGILPIFAKILQWELGENYEFWIFNFELGV